MKKLLTKCKHFLAVFFAIMGFHIIENLTELTLARYTDINILFLLVGSVILPLLLTFFIRAYHGHHGH